MTGRDRPVPAGPRGAKRAWRARAWNGTAPATIAAAREDLTERLRLLTAGYSRRGVAQGPGKRWMQVRRMRVVQMVQLAKARSQSQCRLLRLVGKARRAEKGRSGESLLTVLRARLPKSQGSKTGRCILGRARTPRRRGPLRSGPARVPLGTLGRLGGMRGCLRRQVRVVRMTHAPSWTSA